MQKIFLDFSNPSFFGYKMQPNWKSPSKKLKLPKLKNYQEFFNRRNKKCSFTQRSILKPWDGKIS